MCIRLLTLAETDQSVKLSNRIRYRCYKYVELYLHSSVCLHAVALIKQLLSLSLCLSDSFLLIILFPYFEKMKVGV
jgi:hypothetical protein